jgi:hypothetical protein
MGVMISSKHLVTFLCLLLIAASGEGRAASSSTDASSDSTTASSTTGASTSSATSSHKHHHRHHATTAAAGTSSTGTETASATTDKKKTNGKSSPAEAETNPPATASTTAPAHGSKKKHGSSTAAAAPAATTPGAPGATATPGAGATTANATPVANAPVGAAAQTTTAKPGRHRHHREATPTPIVVAPSTTPLVLPPAAPQTTVTLPVTAPLSGVKLPPSGAVPTVMTGLPVARPGTGTTATLPIGMVRNPTPSVLTNFPFTDFSSRKRTQTYPWKVGIVTTVFWIGEDASAVSNANNHASAWDLNWEHNNGGADDQYDLNGYASAEHASMLNPFYVALPFNDLAYPDEAARWLPSNWSRPPRRDGKAVSACQGRWVEIKNRAGRVCFAQWEDVGPLVTDNAEYVFGPERPSARAGLDVSPAVAKYLGIDSTAYTSWRFVDDEDVQPGMWLRYDEQALLFRALEEQMHGGRSNRPIQDMEEPVPDGSNEDSNQKKAGAARG